MSTTEPATTASGRLATVGVVAIGRNEGERLRRCIESIPKGTAGVVYVDSGSTDGSQEWVREQGWEVVELDLSRPFTAARARNAGMKHLQERFPQVRLVQFVDGDCSLAPGWLEHAAAALAQDPRVVAVWGRRRERHPEASVYNRLCDLEWGHTPPGETGAFGGDVMVRLQAALAVDGYDPNLIAGEDPEFALRLRQASGGTILRLNAEMTAHDAAMTRLGQWWTRATRAGHAYAELAHLHRDHSERPCRAECRRILFWGLGVPATAVIAAGPTLGWSLLLALAYPARAVRTAWRSQRQGLPRAHAWAWAWSCTFSSFPELQGLLRYHRNRLLGRQARIIEYKDTDSPPAG